MSRGNFVRKVSASGAACALAALCATSYAAGPKVSKKSICTPAAVAYKEAVVENKEGHAREARASLATCMEATACAGLIPKCRALSEKIAEKMSSVIPVVVDESGTPQLDIQVKVDGEVLASHIDGMAVLVEPGAHDFTFSNAQGVVATQKVLVLEGQRDRAVTVTIGGQSQAPVAAAPAKPAPEAKPEPAAEPVKTAETEKPGASEEPVATSHVESSGGGHWAMPKSVFPYILGGVGVAGVAAGAVLTFWGNKDNSDLESGCSPTCKPTSLDHVKTMYVAADISFGAGAVALAVSTILFATSHSTEGSQKPAPRDALRVDVAPTQSGAFASVSGAF
ncbi:MAG TPA: hypothetical protein VGM06_11390 [Polyangiaceae bacterium]|jgi:hypothetical protein